MTNHNVEELCNALYTMVQDAKGTAFNGDKCVLERDLVLNLVDDIRSTVPAEVKKAKELMEKKNDYIAAAKKEADELRQKAEDYVRKLLNEDELVVEAKRLAEKNVQEAEDRSREIKHALTTYCEETLDNLENAVADTYDSVRDARAKFYDMGR